jgi:hypothetical protein
MAVAKYSQRVLRRRTVTLPLPGDADAVLRDEIRRALKRDGHLNWQEFRARAVVQACFEVRKRFDYWYCTRTDPCYFCEELDLL